MNRASHIWSHFVRRYLRLFLVALIASCVVELPLLDSTIAVAYAKGEGRTPKKGKEGGKGRGGERGKGKTATKKGAKGTKSAKKGVKGKGTKSAKKESPRKPARVVAKKKEPAPIKVPIEVLVRPDSMHVIELAEGVTYSWIRTTGDQIANVIALDLKSGARLRSYKALERCDGLQKANDIAIDASESLLDTIIAATNASFWRAGSNTPIGPTITDGEVIEMPGYKLWSSLMVYEDGSAAIDRVTLRGEVFWRSRHFSVSGVNRRGKDEIGVVVYNRYYGDSLPRGSRKSDSIIVAEAFANKVGAEIGDDTEGNGIDTAEIIRSYREEKVLEDREHPILKIACVPLKPRRARDPRPRPNIGDTMRLVVTAVDTGVVEIPENGYVLSLGDRAEWFTVADVGDTIALLYTITPNQPQKVRELLTGTPRLVRNGEADPEYETEGSRARRFIDGKLARTAVGISKGGDSLFLVTINSPNKEDETTGMTLAQLAAFMQSIGAYQAMNFDGGGSASMALNGVMVSRQGSRPTSRRVSNALLVVKAARAKEKKPRRAMITE